MERLGLTIGLEGAGLREAVELGRRAEELGYTDLWTAEVGGIDALTPLAALAATTTSARLGTGILPVFTRPPALLAMSAASLQDLSGGRFVLGLGTSSNVIVEKWMGGSFTRPLTRLRECVEVVRAALTGDKVAFHGLTTQVDGFRLQHTPVSVPIHLAALGPTACALAGEVADGIIFFLKTTGGVRTALGWAEAARDGQPLECVMRLPYLVDEEPEILSVAARRLLLSYAPVDVYARSLAAQGFGSEIAAIREAWAAGDRRRAVEVVPDAMIDALFIMGGPERAAARLEELRDAGVTTPVLLPMSFADPGERQQRIRRAVEALAPG